MRSASCAGRRPAGVGMVQARLCALRARSTHKASEPLPAIHGKVNANVNMEAVTRPKYFVELAQFSNGVKHIALVMMSTILMVLPVSAEASMLPTPSSPIDLSVSTGSNKSDDTTAVYASAPGGDMRYTQQQLDAAKAEGKAEALDERIKQEQIRMVLQLAFIFAVMTMVITSIIVLAQKTGLT